MMGLFGGGGGVFESSFRAYPVSFIDRPELENGDKVILPPSALDRLSSLHIEFPMLFEISNLREGRVSHCGVMEFVADEGVVYLPYWMMQNLLLQEGDIVKFKSASLPKGSFVKLRPQSKDFLDISNPKAVLETTLRRYSCLTTGDSILINYNNKRYFIDIMETKPPRAVTIIETDCEVDFAPPLDYVEPVPQPKLAPAAAAVAKPAAAPVPESAPEPPKFAPFQGSAKRLDGKEVAPIPVPAPAAAPAAPATSSMGKSPPVVKNAAGKLVFGGAKPGAPKPPAAADAKPEVGKAEPPKFTAFSGTGNKLK